MSNTTKMHVRWTDAATNRACIDVKPEWTEAHRKNWDFEWQLGDQRFVAFRQRSDYGWCWFETYKLDENGKLTLIRNHGGLFDTLTLTVPLSVIRN